MSRATLLSTLALTAIAPLVWGSTYIVTSELLPPDSPLMAAMLRALPAGIGLVLFTRRLPSGIWWLRLITLGFLNIGFFFYCLFFAATYLPGGMAALVMAIQPILVIGLSYYLLNSPLKKQQLFASVIAIGSVVLLIINNQIGLSSIGLIMGSLGTVSMAMGIVLTKLWGRPDEMSLLNFTGWQLLFGGLMLLPVAWWFEGFPETLSANNIIGYVYLCVVGAIVAYSLWFNGIAKLPAISISFLGFLSSVSAVLLGYIFLEQSLTFGQCVGVVGIFIAIMLATPQKETPVIALKDQ